MCGVSPRQAVSPRANSPRTAYIASRAPTAGATPRCIGRVPEAISNVLSSEASANHSMPGSRWRPHAIACMSAISPIVKTTMVAADCGSAAKGMRTRSRGAVAADDPLGIQAASMMRQRSEVANPRFPGQKKGPIARPLLHVATEVAQAVTPLAISANSSILSKFM